MIYNPSTNGRVKNRQEVFVTVRYDNGGSANNGLAFIDGEFWCRGKIAPCNLWRFECFIICTGSQFPPEFPLIVSFPKFVFILRKMPMNCRISLGKQRTSFRLGPFLRPRPFPVGAAGNGNEIQPRPLRFPFPDVTAAEPGFDQVGAPGIFGDEAFSGRLVDDRPRSGRSRRPDRIFLPHTRRGACRPF